MLSEKVRDIRVNWKISDDKRDEGLTTPEDIVRFDNISYGPYGSDNLLDIYHQKEVTKPQKTIISVHGGGWFMEARSSTSSMECGWHSGDLPL